MDNGNALIVEGVKVGDIIHNTTDGSSCVTDVITATNAECAPPGLVGGTLDTWVATDSWEIDMDEVSLIKFKVTPSPGAQPFSLDQANTVVSFNDANNNLNGVYAATILDVSPFVSNNVMEWTHNWLVGTGPGISTGDVVEFTIQVKGLTKPLSVNSAFSVEIVPQSGSALSISRTTPLEMALVMDLN
jgi:archaellin